MFQFEKMKNKENEMNWNVKKVRSAKIATSIIVYSIENQAHKALRLDKKVFG